MYDASDHPEWKRAERLEALINRLIGLGVVVPFLLLDIALIVSGKLPTWGFYLGISAAVGWPLFIFFLLEGDLHQTRRYPLIVTPEGIRIRGDVLRYAEVTAINVLPRKIVIHTISREGERRSIAKRLIPNISAFIDALPEEIHIS